MRGQWRVTRPSDNIARMKFRIRPILLVFFGYCETGFCDYLTNPCRFFAYCETGFFDFSYDLEYSHFGSTYVCDLCNEQSSFYITDMKDLYEWPVSTVLGLGKVWVLELKQVNFIGGTSSLEVFFACLRCCVLLS